MKAFFCLVAASAALVLSIPVAARAQTQTGASVAVVDIGEIFKNHPTFTTSMESLKSQVQAYEQQLETRGKEIMSKKTQLEQNSSLRGTSTYKTEEEKLARMQADLAIEAQSKRKEFIEQEAQLYYDTYTSVQTLVSAYARQRGISVVLRFNRIEMKAEDQKTILQGVNRPVVYYDPSMDITDVIVSYLQRTANGGGAARSR